MRDFEWGVRAAGGKTGGMTERDPERRYPIGELLPGLEVHPLPSGWTPLEAIVFVKCLDEQGHSSWSYRTTHRLNDEEVLGALIVHAERLRRDLVDAWREEEDE